MDSREFFFSAREAARNLARWSRTLEVLESENGVRAQTYEPKTRSGYFRDATSRIDRNIDARERVERSIDGALETIGDAEEVCDGIAEANPHNRVWSESVYLYYVSGLSWDQVGERMGYSKRQCQRFAAAAMDWVDGVGIARAREYARTAA